MASTQRPRPRARKATVDAVNGSTIESVRSFHRTPSAPNRVIVDVDGEDDNDDDDDDDEFFTRKKVTKAPKAREIAARTQSAPTFDHSEDYFSKEDREEVGFDEEHNLGSSDSDGEGRRRKRLRQNLPLWTKTASYSKIELSSRQPSSSQERVIEEGSTVLGRLEKSSSRSPSLTPPPALEQEVLDKLHSVLEQYNPAKKLLDINDDEDDSMSHDSGLPLDLDPDLVRLIKGDRARELRKLAKEKEQRQREEEERLKRTNMIQRADTLSNVIEVDDSEEDLTRTTRDSSPVEIVSSSFPAKSTAQASAVSLPAPVLAPPRESSPVPVVEENERISIVMKGGQGGTLQALVKVKPSSMIKRLLDHFKTMHKDSIPKGKLTFVKLRFDGEILNPNMTVGEVGIEDEEQVDVIW